MRLASIFTRGKGVAGQLKNIVVFDSRRRLTLFQILLGLIIALIFMLLGYFFPVHFYHQHFGYSTITTLIS